MTPRRPSPIGGGDVPVGVVPPNGAARLEDFELIPQSSGKLYCVCGGVAGCGGVWVCRHVSAS